MPAGAIDHTAKTITSTHHQLHLDYEHGVLTINAPKAQGASGNLKSLGSISLADLSLQSNLELGHFVLVSLDDRPIHSSARMLLQVMSEEQNSGWQTEPTSDGKLRILSLGRDPWQIKSLNGSLRLLRPDADRIKVTALDPNGTALADLSSAGEIKLRPDTIYYLLQLKE